MVQRLFFVFGLGLSISLSLSCGSKQSASRKCGQGEAEQDGQCRVVCQDNSDCASSFSCVNNGCIQNENEEEELTSCPNGHTVESACGECPQDKIEVDGSCVEDLCFEKDCHGHGVCESETGICLCDENFDEASNCASCEDNYFLDKFDTCQQTCEAADPEGVSCPDTLTTVATILDFEVRSRQVCSVETGERACVFGESFGAALTTGDFDNNGVDDVVSAAPLALERGADEALYVGAVYLSMGSLDDGVPVFTRPRRIDAASLGHTPQNGALFGFSVAAGDFNDDGYDDLAVGSPAQDVVDENGVLQIQAGVVDIVYGNEDGLDSNSSSRFSQSSTGMPQVGFLGAKAEAKDHFGFSLAAAKLRGVSAIDDLAVGAPGENFGGGADADCSGVDGGDGSSPSTCSAGVVYVLYGNSNGLSPENSNGVIHISSATSPGGVVYQERAYYGYALTGTWESPSGGGICTPSSNGPCGGYQRLAVGEPGRRDVYIELGDINAGGIYGLRLHDDGSGPGFQRQERLELQGEMGDVALGRRLASFSNYSSDSRATIYITGKGDTGAYRSINLGDEDVTLSTMPFLGMCGDGAFVPESAGAMVLYKPNGIAGHKLRIGNGDGTLATHPMAPSCQREQSGYGTEGGYGAALAAGSFTADLNEGLVVGAPYRKHDEALHQLGAVNLQTSGYFGTLVRGRSTRLFLE